MECRIFIYLKRFSKIINVKNHEIFLGKMKLGGGFKSSLMNNYLYVTNTTQHTTNDCCVHFSNGIKMTFRKRIILTVHRMTYFSFIFFDISQKSYGYQYIRIICRICDFIFSLA